MDTKTEGKYSEILTAVVIGWWNNMCLDFFF